jgi:osmoprotectant transport system permease protein
MSFLLANPAAVAVLAWQHVQITAAAVLLAAVMGVPLGILIHRVGLLAVPVLSVAGVLYTIPSLALFALLIPLMGLGVRPAITALVLYSLLVVIRNTAAGLRSVPEEVVDAARGIGMSGLQRLWHVELPLALPVIMAGIRVAAVMDIGIAAVAAYIGAGGLGELIFRGLATLDMDRLLTGTVAVAALALAADWGLTRVEMMLRR